MDYIVPIIEQLSRAASELRSKHAVHHRLGYILVDNAAELIVHKYAQTQADVLRNWPGQDKLTGRQLRMARKGKFDDKLSVLVALQAISATEQRFGSICHEYRNQVYHAGVRHERVMKEIGCAYFRWCCDLFGRLPPMFYSSGSHSNPTPRARRLIERVKAEHDVTFVPHVHQIAPYLRKISPRTAKLAEVLSSAAEDAIDQIKENINFILKDSPTPITIGEIVHESQQWWEVEQRLEAKQLDGRILWSDTARIEERNQLIQCILANFRPKFTKVPIASWKKRCETIGRQSNEILALNRYQDLRDAMQYLENAISEMAFSLDMHIQQEIDRARGK